MNAGKAVIVSDRVGAGFDLVKNSENGYIFSAGDVNALAICLEKILTNPSKCKRMGTRSLDIIARWSFIEDVNGIRQALCLPPSKNNISQEF